MDILELYSSMDQNNRITFVLSFIGALAWIPSIVQLVVQVFEKVSIHKRKIKMNIVDIQTLSSAKVTNAYNTKCLEGSILVLAVNMFIADVSFFANEVYGKVYIGTTGKTVVKNACLVDGEIVAKFDVGEKILDIPDENNFNLHREIICEKDNVRVLPFMVEDVVNLSVRGIEKIEIIFEGKEKKKVVIKNQDFPQFNHMGFLKKRMIFKGSDIIYR